MWDAKSSVNWTIRSEQGNSALRRGSASWWATPCVDTPSYRVWDPSTHRVWDVRAPDFDESVRGGWWRKPVVDKKPVWEGDEPLELVYVMDPPANLPMEQPMEPSHWRKIRFIMDGASTFWRSGTSSDSE